jgi:hypothetical protein
MNIKHSHEDRRDFLKSAAGLALSAPLLMSQQPAAPVPPPKKARITSSVMLWTLKGSFDEKLATAADAGIQSVELVTEYQDWSDAEAEK